MIFQCTITQKRTPGWTPPSSKRGFMKGLCQDVEKHLRREVSLSLLKSLCSSDGKISCLYLSSNTTSLIQLMD